MIRMLAPVALSAACLCAGWYAHGIYQDSKDLAVLEAVNTLEANARAEQSEIARIVEDRLGELTASKTVIDRGIIREIEQPIYRNVCLTDAAVSMLNKAASGTGENDTAKPAD